MMPQVLASFWHLSTEQVLLQLKSTPVITIGVIPYRAGFLDPL
jgi:hypothetical protein